MHTQDAALPHLLPKNSLLNSGNNNTRTSDHSSNDVDDENVHDSLYTQVSTPYLHPIQDQAVQDTSVGDGE